MAPANGGGGPERDQHEADVVHDGQVAGVHPSAACGRRSLSLPRKGVGSGGPVNLGGTDKGGDWRDEARAGACRGRGISDREKGSDKSSSSGHCPGPTVA